MHWLALLMYEEERQSFGWRFEIISVAAPAATLSAFAMFVNQKVSRAMMKI